MRTSEECKSELELIRVLLRRAREDNLDTDMLYGAQQALGWVIGELGSPSALDKLIEKMARELTE